MSIAAKLGASLVMPPPSQANTLRKPAVCQDVTVAGRSWRNNNLFEKLKYLDDVEICNLILL